MDNFKPTINNVPKKKLIFVSLIVFVVLAVGLALSYQYFFKKKEQNETAKTSPIEIPQTNPFEEAKTNPFKDIKTNPFE